MRVGGLVLLAGCGRFAFDPSHDAATTGSDTAQLDALPAGLVAWFPLSDASPDDVVGGGNGTCVVPTCPTPTTGHRDSGLLFDGVDDCIVVLDYPALRQPSITIGIWAYLSVAQDAAAFSKRVDVGANVENTWELGAAPAGELELTTNHAGVTEQIATSPGVLAISRWHHIAFTWDGSTKRMYVDGIERGMGAGAAALQYDAQNLTIGCDDDGFPARWFDGILDELMIFDHAMSSAQVLELTTL